MTLKHLSTALIVALSGTTFAGAMGPVCTNGQVSLACENRGWDVGIQALYLQPIFGDDLRFIGANTQNGRTDLVANSPDWSWGFKLEGAYHFNVGSDINLNWSHWDGKKTKIKSNQIFFTSVDISEKLSTVKPRWDAVNLEVGNTLNSGELKKIHLHAGVQYALIKTNISQKGSFFGEESAVFPAARFQGIGPRLGSNLGYELTKNWAVYANGAAAVLVGQSSFQNVKFSDNPEISLNKRMVVPELEAKLGINYTGHLANNVLILDAGYMWVNYFNAQQTYYGADPDNNFSLHGPYLGLKWVGVTI